MAFIPAPLVTGAIVPGVCDAPTEPTYSVVLNDLTSSGQDVGVPDAARYVDLALTNSTAAPLYGAGAPILSLRAGDFGVPQLIRDYSTGVCIPPYPAAIGGFNAQATPTTGPLAHVDTDVTCDALLTFYLEF